MEQLSSEERAALDEFTKPFNAADGSYLESVWIAAKKYALANAAEQPMSYCADCGSTTEGLHYQHCPEAAAQQPTTREIWQHLKTGGVYEIIAPEARAEWEYKFLCVVYRGEDGQTWFRPYHEFHDGRFVLVDK